MGSTYGSLFSGAGGIDIGFDRAGMECRWQCEIDPQASAVLARHWPAVRRFGDVRAVRKKDLSPVDVLVGGFPCQGLSVAGKRGGLNDERSGLFYELVRVARLCRPRFVVWENVPGLLDSDDGRDFARVLRALADIGYFGSWRVLDARHFGVPQRRRRVFGVFTRGRFGSIRCGEILALTSGVPGHPEKSREAGEDLAGTLTGGARKRDGHIARDESGLAVSCTLSASTGGVSSEVREMEHAGSLAAKHGMKQQNYLFIPDEAFTLKTQDRRVGNGWNGNMAATAEQVRRLTPVECERLMSWPDDHTRYAADGTEFADGPRYRMCGNGVVSNCAEWLARRLAERSEG